MVRLSSGVLTSPEYPFKKINDIKIRMIKKGVRVIDLGVGDTFLSAPEVAVEAMKKAVDDTANHHYNSYNGLPFFRETVSEWMLKRFGIKIDPENEITAVIGTKEALFRIPSAFIDSGDIALIPEPVYPALVSGLQFSGGSPYTLPLKVENRFLPDLDNIPEKIRQKAKFIYINYPNNPSTAEMTSEFAKKLLKFAEKYDWGIVSDMAYSEIYEKTPNISLLEFEGAMDRVVEFHSLSKTYSMTGFRIGFAAGNKDIISALVKIKSIRGSSPFQPVQAAAAAALKYGEDYLSKMRELYSFNRKMMKSLFSNKGLEFFHSSSTFYIWACVPEGMTSLSFSEHMLEKYGTIVTPGALLGQWGEGWFRACFARPAEELEEFVNRFGR